MKSFDTRWKIRLLLVLALILIIGLLSVTGALAQSSRYGKVTGDKRLNVRKGTSTTTQSLFQLQPGTVCEVTGTTHDGDGTLWYYVIAAHPTTKKLYNGCVMGDFFQMLSDSEEAQYLSGTESQQTAPEPQNTEAPAPTATPKPTAAPRSSAVSGVYGYINRGGGTNFRKTDNLKGTVIDRLTKQTVVEILEIPRAVTNDSWYKVRYNGNVGYIMAQYITLTTEVGDLPVSNSESKPATEPLTPTNTPKPTATPTPTAIPPVKPDEPSEPATTPAPAAPAPAAPAADGQYVQLIKTSCHLRNTPNGSYDQNHDWVGAGNVLPITGKPITRGAYIWYPVTVEGKSYYVRSDCVTVTGTGTASSGTPKATETAKPTVAPTAKADKAEEPAATSTTTTVAVEDGSHVQLTKSSCHLRETPNGSYDRDWLAREGALPITGKPVVRGEYVWYPVTYDGSKYYVRSDCVTVIK